MSAAIMNMHSYTEKWLMIKFFIATLKTKLLYSTEIMKNGAKRYYICC